MVSSALEPVWVDFVGQSIVKVLGYVKFVKLHVIKNSFLKAYKSFFSFFWILRTNETLLDILYGLNKVLLLKLLQIVAIRRSTIAWDNFFIKKIYNNAKLIFLN